MAWSKNCGQREALSDGNTVALVHKDRTGWTGVACCSSVEGNMACFVSRLRLCIFAGNQGLLMLEALGTRGWRIEQAELSSPPGTMVFV